MFDTNWNVDKYKAGYEPEEHWNLRRQFMLAHKDKYPENKLVCLTQVFFNMEFLGCKYPEKTMEIVNELADAVAEEFREARKGKLKRTFVGAKDAAGAKAKGGKPPPGFREGVKKQEERARDQTPPSKKPRFDDDGPLRQQYSDVHDSNSRKRGSGPSDAPYSTKSQGGKPPPGFREGVKKQEERARDQTPPSKKSRFDDDGPLRQSYTDVHDSNSSKRGSDAPYSSKSQDISDDMREAFRDFVFMLPTRSNSKIEGDPMRIIHHNFSEGMVAFYISGEKRDKCYKCDMMVNPTPNSGKKPQYQIASVYAQTHKECKLQASAIAIEKLKTMCSIIEPNPEWFQDGGTPEFIRKRIPCNQTPRRYLIMTKNDTGHITPQVADILMDNFSRSSNEDMFFIDSEYNEKEKNFLVGRCQAHKLGFRHFGSGVQLSEHHVCIYKTKEPQEIMEEARSLGWKHPKYLIRLHHSHTSFKPASRQW